MNRQNIKTGAKWEDLVAYSRAVRLGNCVEVSGTVSIKDGQVYGKGDAYLQTKRIIEIIEESLIKAGAKLSDVVRTRIYVTDISRWEEVGKAHKEAFESIMPSTSMIGIKELISEDYIVEIEATAVVGDQ